MAASVAVRYARAWLSYLF